MPKFILVVLWVFVLIVVSGCGDGLVDVTLNRAEALVDVNPDSALIVLETINANDISSDSQKARYVLLYTHAKFISTGGLSINDSTINIAADFYRNNGTAKERTLSLLYQSNYLMNRGNRDDAMLNLIEVEEIFAEYNDNYAQGLYNLLLGVMYQVYFDEQRAIDSYRQAQHYLSKDDNVTEMYLFSKIFEGSMLCNKPASYNRAIELIRDAQQGFEANNQKHSVTLCKCLLTLLYVQTGQFEKAENVSKDITDTLIIPNNFHSNIFSAKAYLYFIKNDMVNSRKYIDLASKYATSKSDSLQIYNFKAKKAVDKGDYKQAFEFQLKASDLSKEIMTQRLESPLMTSQRDYLKKELENNKVLQKYEKQRNIAIISVILILSVSFILYLRRLNKNKQRRLDEYAGVIYELQTTLQDNKSATSELIQTLYKDQFKILNGISDSFFNRSNDAKGQKYVYNEVKYFIEQFSKDKKSLQDLENTVNKCCDNVMKKLREEMPDLDEIDYKQLCYHYAGFSGKLISILLDKSQANIYMRKSRLKEKIQQSNIQSKDAILKFLL